MSLLSKRGRRSKTQSVLTNVKAVEMQAKTNSTKVKIENYNFIITGVAVNVSGRAKNAHICQESMGVNF